MKKVININFQGRVIPIEETAYDILKQYIESLRRYFANEEGRDEIINDIESRIAELFSERLKKGATCITDEDVNAVIASMGRPEDFEQAEAQNAETSSSTGNSSKQQSTYTAAEPRRLYRTENDKILGGVCGGLANYLRLDPAIVRILFALITFGGFGLGVLVYIVMWIIVPARTLTSNIRKRLYRDPDNKVFGGVASGLAAYFKIDVWIPRLIFALPLILSIIISIVRASWFEFREGPAFLTGGFGGTLFIIYIILWIVLPEAVTASEKLEMRGERVDLQSIKNTIKEDLENFKTRAEKWGQEVKQTSQQYANQAAAAAKTYSQDTGLTARSTGSGIAHAIGVLFKAFFLFIAGMIAFVALMALIGLLFGGVAFFPFKNYVLDGFWQNFLAWSVLIFFLGVPIIAFVTWLIRRLIGVRSRSHYMGYIFGTLWIYGLVCAIILTGSLIRNFRTEEPVGQEVAITTPSTGKVLVKVSTEKIRYWGDDYWGFNDDDNAPFFNIGPDSLMMNTIRVRLVKSKDSAFHVYQVKFSHGPNPAKAEELASQISFGMAQSDSVLTLPRGFVISKNQKFRNQKVLVVVEVPVGKRVEVDRSVDQYKWFSIEINRRNRYSEWDDRWDNSYWWQSNVEYIMTDKGLKRTDNKDEDHWNEEKDEQPDTLRKTNEQYRYRNSPDSNKTKTDTVPQRKTTQAVSPMYNISRLV